VFVYDNPKAKIPIAVSGTGKAIYGLQIWKKHSQGPSEQKSIKNLGEKGTCAYPRTAQFFKVPPIIPGMGKARNFKFCTHIHRIDRNKKRYKFREK